ncbi:hypothetical protein SAMN02745866_01757 [Alteromonadaceae bacterium Bs31]|nr:hypothetical protein SAMN02745866_01757 [Alteromonadaceae bacterium Bs31]
MGIVIEEVQAEVAPADSPEQDLPQGNDRGPSSNEIAQLVENQLARVKRRCERVQAD